MIDLFYWAMVALFITHELDAVRRHEWRILPILNNFSEEMAENIFVWLHAPVFLMIVWMSKDGAESIFPLALSAFAVIHVGLHCLLRNHDKNEFKGAVCWMIIVLTGVFGALHLLAFRYM